MNEITYETRGTDIQWMKNLLFAGVFIQENRLHAVFDRYNELTCKQWLLMVVSSAFEEPQDLTSLGKAMGCSRQNVKKLAQQLEKSGYIQLVKSETDARALCIKRTPKGETFAKESEALGKQVHEAVFSEFTDEDVKIYYELSIKMMHGIENLEKVFQSDMQNGL